MRKMSFTSWMLVACAVALLATLQTTTGQDENPLIKLSTAITSFSTDLMVKLINSRPDVANVIFSPTSIYVALAMLYPGSGGETKSQLAKALNLEVFKSDENEFYESIKILLQTMNSTQKGHTLKRVNRLFAEKGSKFNDDYLKKLDDYFSSKPEVLDFSGDASGSTSKINKWVARMTSDKIKELFPKGIITSDRPTHLALASAVYFNAPWLYKFDKKNTKLQAFHTYTNKKVQVPMMNLPFVAGLSYLNSKESGFQVLELPYAGGKFATLIFLMNKNVSSNSLQKRRVIDQAEDAYRPKNVSVKLSLPKFALSPTINLKQSLQALGIEDLFNGDIVDLSNMVPAHSVPLSAAMHRTFFAFKEDGTQEAGATEGHNRRPFLGKPIDFVVDRTFLFKVLEKATDCELLYGFIANPVKSD